MTKEEFEQFYETDDSYITVDDLTNTSPRDLIYGYTKDRETFILQLDDGGSFVRHYGSGESTMKEILPEICIPNKRVYPDASDYEFCTLLKERGIIIPFTIYPVKIS